MMQSGWMRCGDEKLRCVAYYEIHATFHNERTGRARTGTTSGLFCGPWRTDANVENVFVWLLQHVSFPSTIRPQQGMQVTSGLGS